MISSSETFNVPVLFIAFNRPRETKLVLDAIGRVKPAKLYIAADGPRKDRPQDVINCDEVRRICKTAINWPCEVNLRFRNDNLGCGGGPRDAYDWFFSNEESGIILEDDCVPSKSFFSFCEEMLNLYRNDDKVFSINGNNFGYEASDPSSFFFGRFMNPCGWATWRKSYKLVDYDLSQWEKIRFKKYFLHRRLNRWFDFDLGWIKYWEEIFDNTREKVKNGSKIQYWDYQWIYSQLLEGRYSIIPPKNLITNIGYNENGTHITDENDRLANLRSFELKLPINTPKRTKYAIEYNFEKNFVKKLWCYQKGRRGLYFYFKMEITKLLGKSKVIK